MIHRLLKADCHAGRHGPALLLLILAGLTPACRAPEVTETPEGSLPRVFVSIPPQKYLG